MPYDSENKRLYVDTSVTPNIGISLKNISDCLRDYRRNSKGAIDLGMMCTSPNINMWALYRPYNDYNNITREATLEDRKNSDYGLIVSSEQDADDSRFYQNVYEINVAPPYRLLDFNGYDGLAECGFAIYPVSDNSFPTAQYVDIKMRGSTGSNIALEHMADVINFEGYDTFGVELRSESGSIPLWSTDIDSIDTLQNVLASNYAVYLLTMYNAPKGTNAKLYIYGKSGYVKDAIHEPITIIDSRTPDSGVYSYHHFAPNMKVGTFASGLKSVNGWNESNGVINIGTNDYFRLGFYLRKESEMVSATRLCLKTVIGNDLYYIPIYSSKTEQGTIDLDVWQSLGPTSYDGDPVFYCSWADFADLLTRGEETDVTVQLCEINTVNKVEYLRSAPIHLTISYTGTTIQDELDFPPIPEPDWSGGFDI